MIFNIIQKFENLIYNLIDIVAHPIKNISYISVFILYFIFYIMSNKYIQIKWKRNVSIFGRDGNYIDIYRYIFSKCNSRI